VFSIANIRTNWKKKKAKAEAKDGSSSNRSPGRTRNTELKTHNTKPVTISFKLYPIICPETINRKLRTGNQLFLLPNRIKNIHLGLLFSNQKNNEHISQ